jgi:acyl-CoA thioesterase I
MNWKDGAFIAALQRTLVMVALALAICVPVAAKEPRTVLVMGDSLSAGYNMRADETWVALTDARMRERTPGWKVVNASISGETTAGGATRIVDAVTRHRPAVVIIELGANDGIRGLDPMQTRINLARMIGAAHGVGAKVLLVGMRLPPNFGPEHVRAFHANYPELAKRYGTALVPFLLEPVATERDAFQDDNTHPIASVQWRLRDHVWPALEPLLH